MRTLFIRTIGFIASALLLTSPAIAFAGSQTYSTPGTHTFTVPQYTGDLLVEVWGGGGAGQITTHAGENGGHSVFKDLAAYGGGGATDYVESGQCNGVLSNECTTTYHIGGYGGGGRGSVHIYEGARGGDGVVAGKDGGHAGKGANGGAGGLGAYVDLRDAENGSAPGGGGGGGTYKHDWITSIGGKYYGGTDFDSWGGGGGGGYAYVQYYPAILPPGTSVSVVVGSGGAAYGRMPDGEYGIPGGIQNNGGFGNWYYYKSAGNGAPGAVKITWDDACPLHSHGTFPSCVCDTGYTSNGQTGTGLVCSPTSINLSCNVTFDKNPINNGESTHINWSSTDNPTAFYLNSIGYVGASDSTSVAPSQTTDYSGTVYKCPTGTTLSADRTQCNGTSITTPTTATCPATLTVSGNQCSVGQHWDGTSCVADNCLVGQHWDVSLNQCVSDCLVGQHWNGTSCVADNCAAGQHWDASSNQCVNDICVPTNICNGNDVVNSCTGEIIQTCVAPRQCLAGACTIPAPSVSTWKVSPLLVRSGGFATVTWSVLNAASCTVSSSIGDSWTGLSGTQQSRAITHQTVFTLHCIALSGSGAADVNRTTTVNIVPSFIER